MHRVSPSCHFRGLRLTFGGGVMKQAIGKGLIQNRVRSQPFVLTGVSQSQNLNADPFIRLTAGFNRLRISTRPSSALGIGYLIERLGITEFRRRLFHVAPALLPVALPFVQHRDVWGPILITLLLLVTAVGLTLSVVLRDLVKREGEKQWTSAVLGYALPVVGALLLFPGRAELGLMTLQIVALGDGSATLGGLIFGGRQLPWNQRKTWSGLLCFAVIGALASTCIYLGEASPSVSVVIAFEICSTAALVAGIAESLPLRSNDNFRVGMTALLIGTGMSALLV